MHAFVLAAVVLLGAPPMTLDGFRALPDNRVAVRTSLGVRSAHRADDTHVEIAIGMSVTPTCGDPNAYRIVSEQDPAYAFGVFVSPVAATARRELEATGPPGCPFSAFERTIVTLELPSPMQAGADYTVIAQGSNGSMVTAAHTAQMVSTSALPEAADPVDLAVLGLRRLEPVGGRILCLEFGPGLAPEAASRVESYQVRVNGEPVPVTALGRISRVDTYLPVGWPFQAIPMHEVFLELAQELSDEDRVEVSVAPEAAVESAPATMEFHSERTLTRSIKANQVGYLTDSPVKVAYLGRWLGSFPEQPTSRAPSASGEQAFWGALQGNAPAEERRPGASALAFESPPEFHIHTEDGTVVHSGRSELIHRSGEMNEGVSNVDHSGENVYLLDFTDFRRPGTYFISVPGVGRSLPFRIADDVYAEAFQTAAYGVFAQRCGIELGPPYSEWRRVACHANGLTPTTQNRLEPHDIKVLADRADLSRARVQAVGGHHDAGDYNPRSHIDVAQTLMDAYEIAPAKFRDGQLNVPESGNGVPDILDEAAWALRLWEGLQDADGGVHDGTESNGDPDFITTAELDTLGDYAYAKDAAGSFTAAGAFAQAERIWRSLGGAPRSAELLERAQRAFDWAMAHPPADAGDAAAYAAAFLSPKAYAAAELLRATGDARYNAAFTEAAVWARKPEAEIEVYGLYDQSRAAWAYANCDPAQATPELQAAARDAIIRYAQMLIGPSSTMAYAFIRHPYAPITWGTGAYENNLTPILWAWALTGDEQYRYWMVRTCDNTLGANPLGLSYIVGLGTRTVRAPLHNSRYGVSGEVVRGMQTQGPSQRAEGYRVAETAYPPPREDFASLYQFVDCHFAISIDEGTVSAQAKTMAALGLLLP